MSYLQQWRARHPAMIFLIQWVLSTLVAWFAVLLFLPMVGNPFLFPEKADATWAEVIYFTSLFSVVVGGIQAGLHKILIHNFLGVELDHWVRSTIMGLGLGILIWSGLRFPFANSLISVLPILIIPFVFQWRILRKDGESTWLWLWTGLISSVVFVATLKISPFGLGQGVLMNSTLGAITLSAILNGIMMLYLLPQIRYKQAVERLQARARVYNTLYAHERYEAEEYEVVEVQQQRLQTDG